MFVSFTVDASESEAENEGVTIDESLLFVSGSSLLKLLGKCQRFDCAAQVLPSNINISKKGSLDCTFSCIS